MSVPFPLPLLPNTHKTHFTYFWQCCLLVSLKYSLCLSLEWRWFQVAACALNVMAVHPSAAPGLPGWWHRAKRLSGGQGKGLGWRRWALVSTGARLAAGVVEGTCGALMEWQSGPGLLGQEHGQCWKMPYESTGHRLWPSLPDSRVALSLQVWVGVIVEDIL